MKKQKSIINRAELYGAIALFCCLTAPQITVAQPATTPPAAGKPAAGKHTGYGASEWVDSDHTAPELTQFKTFHSKTVNGDVSYLVYLPPDYDQNKDTRYPVMYELPASAQTPEKTMPQVVGRIDDAIRAHRIDPMIVIGVNGLRGNTMYCDTRDGKWPLETVIIQDLIPHVDATYRTIATREGRAVNGFSMGGYGAAHLGFKFPELFGVISIMAPPLLGPNVKQDRPATAWSRLFPMAMGSDLDYFNANDPFTLVEKNADALRDRTVIRLVCHMEPQEWLWPRCEELHELMVKLKIQHEFYFLTNVKSHNPIQCMDTMGDAAFDFFSSSLITHKGSGMGGSHKHAGAAPAQADPPAKADPPSDPPVAVPTAVAPGESAPAPTGPDLVWETLPDGSQGAPTEFHGVDGITIAAYIRKPAGPGPFPIVVCMHGGKDAKGAATGMGRSEKEPIENMVKAGYAIYAADYRHQDKVGVFPIEVDDTVEAVKAARALPFVDTKRVAYMGQSHGGQVGTRVISRVDLAAAVIGAPAAMDLVQVNKAIQHGTKLVPVLQKMIDDMVKQYGASCDELEKNPAKYGYSSGFTEVSQVRCPVLIVCGRDDNNVPVSMMDDYIAKLRAAGKTVEAYQPDHGPHGFFLGKPEIPESQEAARRIMDFLKRQFAKD